LRRIHDESTTLRGPPLYTSFKKVHELLESEGAETTTESQFDVSGLAALGRRDGVSCFEFVEMSPDGAS